MPELLTVFELGFGISPPERLTSILAASPVHVLDLIHNLPQPRLKYGSTGGYAILSLRSRHQVTPELTPWLRNTEGSFVVLSIRLFTDNDLVDRAGMAELADAADSKSAGLRPLGVQLPLPAPVQPTRRKAS
jgi:hypothetical protein